MQAVRRSSKLNVKPSPSWTHSILSSSGLLSKVEY